MHIEFAKIQLFFEIQKKMKKKQKTGAIVAPVFVFVFVIVSVYCLAAERSSIILMALSATGVPGPKTAATPASKRHW